MLHFKIIQINIRSLKSNLLFIESLLNKLDIDVAILCETWIKPNEIINIKNYNLFTKNRDDGFGGVAICVKQRLVAKETIIDYNPIEFLEVKIEINNLIYTFISLYIPPNIAITNIHNKFEAIIKKYENTDRTFIGGDLNAHHSLWGNDRRTDARGKFIADQITSSQFKIMNDGHYTYFNTSSNTFTAIDLSIVSQDYSFEVNWEVLSDNVGSDHLPIFCQIGRPDPKNHIKNIKKIDMKKLNEIIVNLNFENTKTVEEFENILQNSVDQCTKTIRTNGRYTAKPWWTQKIENLWNIKRRKQQIYFRNKTPYTAIELKKSVSAFKREIKLEKEKTWNKFIEEINPANSLKDIYRRLNLFNPNRKNYSNEFLNTHEKLNKLLAHNYQNTNVYRKPNYVAHNFNNDTIPSQIIKEIIHKNKNTAPGCNNISNQILKMLSDDQIEILTQLLQKMWNSQSFPNSWKFIRAVAINKPGKDTNQIENYRIISLLNVIYKVFNKYLKLMINKKISKDKLLPDNVFGFRDGIGVNEFAVNMITSIEQNNQNNYTTVAISIDIEKAFDRVDIETLIDRMKFMGFENKYLYWIEQMLSNRLMVLTNRDCKAQVTLNAGVPQGDVLSPMLFNVYTSEIHNLQSENVQILQYADDFTILICDKNTTDLNLKTIRFMHALKIVLDSLNLNINFSKCKYMCINLQPFNTFSLNIYNNILRGETELKILGIVFDNKLNFNKHYKETKEKCCKYVNILKIFNNKKGNAHPKSLLNAYNALIKSRLNFGSVVISTKRAKSLNLFQTVMNSSIRSAMSMTRTTPITALLAESGEWPVTYTQELTQIKFICKHIFKNTHIGKNIINLKSTRHLNETYLKYPTLELLPKKINFEIAPTNLLINPNIYSYSKMNQPITNKQLALKEIRLNSQKSAVYTDASIINQNVGIGIFIEETKENIAYTISKSISIKCAEIFAVFMAIKFMTAMKKENIIVYTDSKSTCTSLIRTVKENNDKFYEQQIIKLLIENPRCRVTVQWIPAHSGIEGNEMADTIAKQASLNSNAPITIKLPPDELIRICKQNIHTQWTQEFVNKTQTKGTFNADINKYIPPTKPWFKQSNFSTKHIKIINRLRTGHTFDKQFKHLMKLENNNICNTCNVRENSLHIIDSCTQHNTTRNKYTNIRTKGLTEILKNKIEKEYVEVMNFIEEIGAEF